MSGRLRNLFSIVFLQMVVQSAVLTAAPLPVAVQIENHFGVQVGDTLDVSVLMQSPQQLGGVDFTIHFADSVFKYLSATQDTGLKHWEFFVRSYDSSNAIVRFAAIADLPPPPHPDSGDFHPKGSVARIRFVVLPAWNQDSTHLPFDFYWATCGDNAASNPIGDTLLVIHRLFDFDGDLIWDETDDQHYPEIIRPPHIGLLDSCQQVAAKLQFRIDLQNGIAANYIICGNADASSSIDISDAVYVIAYIFASGPSPQPLISGDVDCSGGVDISDAVLLIAYIFGGGSPPCSCG